MIRMSRVLAALPVVAVIALAPAAAHANFYGYGPHRGFYGGPHPFGASGFVAGTVFGLGVGTAITAPRYYGPRAFYAPPAYYAPRPYYAPPAYHYGPRAYYAPRPYYAPPVYHYGPRVYHGPRAYYGPGYGRRGYYR